MSTPYDVPIAPPKGMNSSQMHRELVAAGLIIDGIVGQYNAANRATLCTVLFTTPPTPTEEATAVATVATHVAVPPPSIVGEAISDDGIRRRVRIGIGGLLYTEEF